jgi:hypothetical protein
MVLQKLPEKALIEFLKNDFERVAVLFWSLT